jgi:hypothetical protein
MNEMTKTLWFGTRPEGAGCLTPLTYRKVTAKKVDEIVAGVENLYEDEQGKKYTVSYNSFMRRQEFIEA